MSMFDEFLRNCQPEDEIKPSKERVEKNISAVMSLIETKDAEENDMTKRKIRLKPLIIAAVIAIFSGLLLLSTSAVIQTTTISFFMSGEEHDGVYSDYVDSKGFRHIAFGAVLPLYGNFAIIYDVDAPQGENMRVITEEADPDFIERIHLFIEARDRYWDGIELSTVTADNVYIYVVEGEDPNYPQPEDFGLVFKDSELCSYSLSNLRNGTIGGNFMHTGAAEGKPNGFGVDAPNECHYDYENGIKTYKETFYYYAGKE